MITQHVRQLERDMQDMQDMQEMRTGTLNVGAGPAVAKSFLGVAVGQFNQQHPHIDINLKLENINKLYAQLLERKIEFIVGDPLYINSDQQIETRFFPKHLIYFFVANIILFCKIVTSNYRLFFNTLLSLLIWRDIINKP